MAYVQQMLAFVTSEVLEPNWRELEEKLRKVETVDQMLSDHVAFLDTCLKEAALTKAELIEVSSFPSSCSQTLSDSPPFPPSLFPCLHRPPQLSSKLILVVANFLYHSKTLNASAQKGFEVAQLIAKGELEVDEKSWDRSEQIRRWEKNFDHNLAAQIERVTFFGGSDSEFFLFISIVSSRCRDVFRFGSVCWSRFFGY